MTDAGGGPQHILDFAIPRGATGATGAAGAAATVAVGDVMTGEPGTPARVVNVGTAANAVFDFIIPRGEPGEPAAPDLLIAVNAAPQGTSAGAALTFGETPLVSGRAVSHCPGATDVLIRRPGIYQAAFHGVASADVCTVVPAPLTVLLNLDGNAVPGATARHTFTSFQEAATVSFSVPFRVTATPATLEVVVDQFGYTFSDIALTVTRLGDAEESCWPTDGQTLA